MSQVETATGGSDDVSRAVVEAVAEAEGVDSVDLTPPLYEAVDPDALNRLFAATPSAGRMEGRVCFRYNGYEVTVWGDGYVSIASWEE
jgi:hypothetical protein